MKNKTKSLIKRIFALVAVFFIVALSIIPCFAYYGDSYSAYTAYSVPFYFDTLYTPYMISDDYEGFESYRFGGMLSFENNSMHSLFKMEYPGNAIVSGYDSSNGTFYASEYFSYLYFETSSSYAEFFNADYILSASNFIINPSKDDFEIYITANVDFDYIEFSCVYVELGDNSNGELKTYTKYDQFENEFNISLDDELRRQCFGDVDVFVYALTIQFHVGGIDNYIDYTIIFDESESLMERNYSAFHMDRNGNIIDVENNSMLPIEEFYKSLGLKEYKTSFENYTADYTSWIGNAVGGFLNMELFPFFSIGGILLICVAIGLVGYFLKIFMGG